MASYNVEYAINVKADGALQTLEKFSSAIQSLTSATGKDQTKTNQVSKNLTAYAKSMSALLTSGTQLKGTALTNSLNAIEKFGTSLGNAIGKISAIPYNKDLTKSLNSISNAVTKLSTIKLPDANIISSINQLSEEVLPKLSNSAYRFKNFSAADAEKMLLAAKYVKSTANVLGQIGSTNASLKKAKAAVGSLREFTEIMHKYNSMISTSGMPASRGGVMSGAKMKNPLKSFASSVNSVVKAINTISDNGMLTKFANFEKILNTFGLLGEVGGTLSVQISTAGAEGKLNGLIEQARQLGTILGSIPIPKIPTPTNNTDNTNNTTTTTNDTGKKDRKGGGGKKGDPKAYGGFQVYGGGSQFFQSSQPTAGGPLQVYGMASRGGAGGSGGSGASGSSSGGPASSATAWTNYMNTRPTAIGFGSSVNPRDYRNWLKTGVRQFGSDMLANRAWSAPDEARIRSLLAAQRRISNISPYTKSSWAHKWWGERGLISMARNSFTRYGRMVEDPHGVVDALGQMPRYFEPGRKEALEMIRKSIAEGKAGPSVKPFGRSVFTTPYGKGPFYGWSEDLGARTQLFNWEYGRQGQPAFRDSQRYFINGKEIGEFYSSAGNGTVATGYRVSQDAITKWLSKNGLRWPHKPIVGGNWDANLWDPIYQREAAARLLQESERTMEMHRAFNRQLRENYRRAVSEVGAYAERVGDREYNPFNPIGINDTNKKYKVPPQARMRAKRTVHPSVMRGNLDKAGRMATRNWADQLAAANDRFVPLADPYMGGPSRSGYMAGSGMTPEQRRSVYSGKLASRNAGIFANKIGNKQWRVAPRPLTGGRYGGLIPKNIGYKVLGPSMLDGGGLGIGSMMKGMGVMYGIMGASQLASSTFKDYVDYNNIMQTTMNILGAHDKSAEFYDEFADMAHTVRRVGVETKFTAPEVADAAKFLAMAGFNSQDIKDAIRPIADIALVGDTDLGSTADVVTNIMTAYGIKGSGMRRAADIMTNTFTMSNTTLPELAQSYKYAAGLLAANGVSFQESAAAFGVLGNAGVKGSQAGTTMRTIIANLRNPTSRQATAWAGIKYKNENGELVGIDTKGKNGKLRSLVDIFGDLAKADQQNRAAGGAGIDMYKLFHKTAAQGATALLAQVDKWNEIINENFMSDGMVAKLAEAKKNTISGLWSQLTSMFTEDGIRSFSGLDTKIRGLLSGAIDALDPSKNPSIQGMMDKGVNVIVDLLDTVKGVTTGLYTTFTHFGGFITSFMKIQMMLMPVLMMLRGLRSVQNLALGGIAMTRSVGNFFGGYGAVSNSIPNIWKRRNNHIFGNGRYTISDIFGSPNAASRKINVADSRSLKKYRSYEWLLSGDRGAKLEKNNPALYNRIFDRYAELDSKLASTKNEKGGITRGAAAEHYKKLRLMAMKRQAIMPITTGIGSIGGMVGGGILGSNIATALGAEEGGGWQMAGSLLGGAAGMGIMGKLGSLAGGALAAGPLGWIAGGAALTVTLGILTYKFIKLKAASDAFVNSTKWSSGLDSEGNLLLHDSLTDMQKRLMILNNEQLTLNQKKERYLELLRQEKDMAKDDEGATVQDVAPKLALYLENSKDTMDSWWNFDDKWNVAKRTAEQMGVENMFNVETLNELKGKDGALNIYNPFNPEQSQDIRGLDNVYRQNIANTMYNYGASWSKGTPFFDIYEKWQKSIYAVTSAEELASVLQGIQAEAATYYDKIDWSKANETDIDKILKSNPRNNPYAVFGLLQSAFDITNNPNNLWRKQGQSILNLVPKLGGDKFPAQEAMEFLNLMGAAGTTQDGGYIDLYSENFDEYMNLNGARWANKTAQQNAESLLKTMLASIGVLHTSYRNAMRGWVMGSHFAQMVGNPFVPDNAPSRTQGEEIIDDNNVKYRYYYDDKSGPWPLWKLSPDHKTSPKGLPKSMDPQTFEEYRQRDRLAQPNDLGNTVPEYEESSYSQTEFAPSSSYVQPGQQAWNGTSVSIDSIPVSVTVGGAPADKEYLAALLQDTLQKKVPEVIVEALNTV